MKLSSHQLDQSGAFIISNPIPSTTLLTIVDIPTICEEPTENVPSTLVGAITCSDTDTTDNEQGVRRSLRRRIPNSKYTDDYVSATISPMLSRVVYPKCSHSPATATTKSTSTPSTSVHRYGKKTKCSPPNSPDGRQMVSKKQSKLATVGTLQLTWPRFGIRNAIHEGKIYSVTNICPLDTSLFVLYHAYKACTEKFRGLFERDDLDAFITIRPIFQLVESDGWITARPY